jgi:hypothetical protein
MSMRISVASSLAACAVVLFGSAPVAGRASADRAAHLVAPAEIAKTLPAPEGWTKTDVRLSQIDISSDCSYTFASATYTKGDVRLKLTIADTGAHPDSLMALVAMIVTLPDGHADKIPPATTIARVKIDGMPAADVWNGDKMKGELAVLVAERFAVMIEALKSDAAATQRAFLETIDLKAVAAMK